MYRGRFSLALPEDGFVAACFSVWLFALVALLLPKPSRSLAEPWQTPGMPVPPRSRPARLSAVHFQQAASLEQRVKTRRRRQNRWPSQRSAVAVFSPFGLFYRAGRAHLTLSLMAPKGKKLLIRHFDLPPLAQET